MLGELINILSTINHHKPSWMTGKSGSKRKLSTEIREPRSGLGDLGKLPEARNLSLTGSLQLWYHIPSTSGAGGDATDTDLAGNQLGENLRFFSSRNCKESKIIKDWPMKTIWPWKKLKKESIVCSIFRAHSSRVGSAWMPGGKDSTGVCAEQATGHVLRGMPGRPYAPLWLSISHSTVHNVILWKFIWFHLHIYICI